MTEVRITIAGHTNHGKTSIIRTLTDDVTFGQVDDRPITVNVTAQRINGMGLPGSLSIFDTPGLERATDALASLNGNGSFTHVMEYFENRVNDTQDLATLKQVREHTDVVLYVVRMTEPVKQDYKDEFHILRISGVPLIPIFNFVGGKNSHKDAWVAYLKSEGCHEYTEYDAHAWIRGNEEDLWNRVKAKLHDRDQTKLIEAWRDYRLTRAEAKDIEASKIITELLRDVAAFRVEARTVPLNDTNETRQTIKNKANDDFAEGVRTIERGKLISLLDAYQLNVGSISRAIVNCAEHPSNDSSIEKTIPDLFGPAVQKNFGLSFFGGATAGALTGGVIDAFVGGASFMTGTVIGAVVGGFLGASRSLTLTNYDKDNSILTVTSSPQMLEVILGRALTLTRDLRQRGFANQSEPDLTSAKKHVPPDAEKLLAKLFDSRKSFFAASDERQAAYKLEANILRWIEQAPK